MGKFVDAIVKRFGDEKVVYVQMSILALNGLCKCYCDCVNVSYFK